jgi:uncharacterized protein YcbK (DUF882 family)
MVQNKHRLKSLQPEFRKKIEELVSYLEEKYPHDTITIACTYRSPEEQDRLFKEGKATTLRGGRSLHQKNLAVDIYFIKDGKIEKFNPKYYKMGLKAEELGLVTGMRWKRPHDPAHIEAKL